MVPNDERYHFESQICRTIQERLGKQASEKNIVTADARLAEIKVTEGFYKE